MVINKFTVYLFFEKIQFKKFDCLNTNNNDFYKKLILKLKFS